MISRIEWVDEVVERAHSDRNNDENTLDKYNCVYNRHRKTRRIESEQIEKLRENIRLTTTQRRTRTHFHLFFLAISKPQNSCTILRLSVNCTYFSSFLLFVYILMPFFFVVPVGIKLCAIVFVTVFLFVKCFTLDIVKFIPLP